jgi:hypothetical protein
MTNHPSYRKANEKMRGGKSRASGSGEILPGECETEALITIINENGTGLAVDMLTVDTVAGLGFVASRVERDGIINAQEASDGFTLTGMADAGSAVVVEVEGAS